MHFRKFNMNIVSVTALGIGSMVGAGIFALLGQVILLAGDKTYLSFIISGIIAMFSGYSYAKLASAYPQSGGLTDYYKHAFSSKYVSGFLSIIYILTLAISSSMMAKSFGIYVSELFTRVPNQEHYINILAVALIISLSLLNMQSSSDVGKTEVFFVTIKVLILLSLILFAFKDYDFTHESTDIKPTTLTFLGSIGITFFAYAGFGVMTNASAEVKNPTATISHSIYLAIGIVIALYISLVFVILNYVSIDEITKDSNVAVAIAAERLMGVWGYDILSVAAMIAFITGINANLFSQFRISKSLAQQKILPEFYNKTFWRNGTLGNFLSTTIIVIATIYFDFNSIVNIASSAYLVSYMATFVANWRLHKETKASKTIIAIGFLAMFFVLISFIANIIN